MAGGRILVMGTRGSGLALAQSGMVRDEIARRHPGLRIEMKVIRTEGDRLQSAGAGDGPLPKGLFTAELERALLRSEVDIAVHSLKDLPVEDVPGLVVAAVPVRAAPHDVLVTRGPEALDALPGAPVIATGSPRRSAELLRARPDARIVPLRGNVDTRVRKLRENADWDAIVLAAAGIARLGPDLSGLRPVALPFEQMLPAPGQGALGIQARADDADVLAAARALDDPATRLAAGVERAFLLGMGGGCDLPLGTLAECDGGWVRFRARMHGDDGCRDFSGRWAEADALAGAEALGRAAGGRAG